jgi:hypothetical protein
MQNIIIFGTGLGAEKVLNSIDFEMDGSGDQTVLTTVKFKYIGHEVKKIK